MIRTQCENIHSIYKYGYGTGLIVSCNFEPRPGRVANERFLGTSEPGDDCRYF